MAAQPSTDSRERSGPGIIARLERLQVWSLSYGFIIIIGLGFLFTFYDIFDINVSFIQTCVDLKPGCTPETALGSLPLPVVLNLAGYVVGTLVLSPVADRIGRRNMLLITMLITGLGSLYNAFAPDYANFVIARVITGIGIGADLAIVNTYINEVSPRPARARFTTMIFINSAVGAMIGIWLGLILTTEAEKWPLGLPFAVAGPAFGNGWRWMYGIGALLALIAVLLRIQLPESPRWLIARDRAPEADHIVADMEERARHRGPLADPDYDIPASAVTPPPRVPYSTLFTNPLYRRRILLLFALWFIGYITVYSYASGFTSVLSALKYPPPEAGVIAAVGSFGFVGGTIVMTFIVEKLERRYWLPIAAAVTLIGAFLIAVAGTQITVALIGSILVFAGFNLWVSPTYALSAECFPTRARTTGFALVDGVGHIGGGIGVLAIAPILPHLSTLGALMLISSFLVIAAVLAQFTPHTRARNLDHISP
ncbi:MFS transporter [Microlunatus elymi]|uniref:MFS transporter n=1 Tax=Microlunatus elymi TaxID=2596828 RepID=A0A516PXK5_9ACTN|nr:MFS transporter [Microlunatus elymi]QDP95914.1 MFS transporter [Microlunatus elymi]